MSKLGETLVKLTALAGGAVIGALLSYWLDEELMKRVHERAERDKRRYEQGLAPQSIGSDQDQKE